MMPMVTGLAVTGLILFVVLRSLRGVGGALRGLAQRQQETRRLLQHGLHATGRVIGLGAGGATVTSGVHRTIEVHVDLEVWFAGRPPYRAQATQMVSELRIASLQPGAHVALRVDAQDASKVILADLVTGPFVPAFGGFA